MGEATTTPTVWITLDEEDLYAIDTGEAVRLDCPLTDRPIRISRDNAEYVTCECCGAERSTEEMVTPNGHGLTDRLRDGGTVVYEKLYNNIEDIDTARVIVRATYSVCGGWE